MVLPYFTENCSSLVHALELMHSVASAENLRVVTCSRVYRQSSRYRILQKFQYWNIKWLTILVSALLVNLQFAKVQIPVLSTLINSLHAENRGSDALLRLSPISHEDLN